MAASLTTYQLTPLYAGPVVGAEPVSVAVAGTVGPTGPAGEQGAQGPAGGGLPVGGLTGTVLQKQSGTDGDADWFDLFGSVNTFTAGQNFRNIALLSPSAATVPLTVVATIGQTAALTRWTDSSAATVASVSAAGVFTGNGFAGPGSALTALAAGNIASGTLADARLSANVPLLDAVNTFAAHQNFTSGTVTSPSAVTVPLSVVGDPFQTAPLTEWYDSTLVGVASVTLAGFVGPGAGLTGLAPANVSAGVFVASQVFTSPLIVRFSGGVAGTDEIEVVHDGNTATLRNKDTGGIRYRNAADNLTTFAVTNVGRAVAVEFQGDGTFLTGVDLLHELGAAEVSVTGATTATLGRMHVCSGTTANYTLTLPTASGNAGKFIGLRMSSALTRLVTIDADGAELIDGQATRVMWAGESAILLCDGTGWTKIAGKAIPMICRMRRNTTQSGVVTATITKVNLNATDLDTTAGVLSVPMNDLGNGVIDVLRAGRYRAVAGVRFDNLSATATRLSGFIVIGATLTGDQYAFSETHAEAGSYPFTPGADILDLSAGDFVTLAGFHNSGVDQKFWGHSLTQSCTATLEEVPTW